MNGDWVLYSECLKKGGMGYGVWDVVGRGGEGRGRWWIDGLMGVVMGW